MMAKKKKKKKKKNVYPKQIANAEDYQYMKWNLEDFIIINR